MSAEDRDLGATRAIQADHGVPTQLPEAVKEPCNDCPWRKNALPGWLGPQTAEEWVAAAHSETPIMCHQTIKESGSYEGTKQCRGAAIFRANVCKSPRRADVASGPVDKENVFADSDEFLDYHEREEEFEGWKTGERCRLLVNKEYASEDEEGVVEVTKVGSVLYGNRQTKLFFKADGTDEALTEVEPFEIERERDFYA